jgi:hypothetical protein
MSSSTHPADHITKILYLAAPETFLGPVWIYTQLYDCKVVSNITFSFYSETQNVSLNSTSYATDIKDVWSY